MRRLVEYLATALVDHPDQVQVQQIAHGSEVIIRLIVDEKDLGRVIGRQGRVANAMRILLNIMAAREGKHAILKIV